ncbi:MAG: hypothetical protein QOJ16_2821, partial [Acidobacteriota bacterium]|nr:hypothetical protein [Acidobacteriota bacterium]
MSNPLRAPARRSADLVRLLRARSIERPDDRAYTFLADGEEEGDRLTFGELDLKARALGALLQRLGLAGERVLLLYPPGLEFVSAFLGCLYGGAVAVPAYPPRSSRMLPRLQAIARDARPAAALTTRPLLAAISGMTGGLPELGGIRWVTTDDVEPGLAAEWEEPGLAPQALAFLQYTSGSTATPKGVMVSHGNLLHNEEMIRLAFRQSEQSVIVGWLPLYHDMGLIGNVLQPLYVGAPCVLMSPVAFLQKPRRWLAAISRYRATTSGGPNFAYELCVRRIPPAEREGLDLSTWEVAFNGAEPVRAETLARFAEAFAPSGFRRTALYPCYGLAEATLFVAGGEGGAGPVVGAFRGAALERDRAAEAPPDDGSARLLVGCGRAWEGQEVAVVDPESGRRCPPDRVGEIWVAGPSVAAGYWERPEETASAFGAHLPGGSAPYLRTGDLGFIKDGELYVTGRLKDLVILRGRNLYPQDLEATAEASHPALRSGGSAAFPVEAGGEERLVIAAEIDRRREGEADAAAAAVRRAVAEEHEVQVHEVVLLRFGSLPKTSSGKVQRHACRAAWNAGSLEAVGRSQLPEEEAGEGGQPAVAGALAALHSASPGERRARLEAWLRLEAAHALGVAAAAVVPDRPLTALGLDSLAAVELKGRVEAALGTQVSLAALLEGATLADLVAAVLSGPGEVAAGSAPLSPVATISAVPSGDGFEAPLSHGQEALWFLDRLAPDSLAYHLFGAARVRRGSLDPDALVRAVAALVERHPALRTTFAAEPGGEPRQQVGETAFGFLRVDATSAEPAELGVRLRQEAHRPFDLARGPLLRLALFDLADGEQALLLAVHHIVADFWSLAVVARDLAILYAHELGRLVPALPPLPLTYADCARWQRERMAGPEGERLWAYWRDRLGEDPPRLDLAAGRPRPKVKTYHGDTRNLRLGTDLATALAALGRDRGATLATTLFAGFAALLYRYTGEEDLLVGSPIAGRGAGTADLVGYFVNPVVLRTDLSGDPSFGELLGRARAVMLAAFEHQDYPFNLLAGRLELHRDPARAPFFDVAFAFEKARGAGHDLGAFALGLAGARLDFAGVELESLPLAPVSAPFDLSLVLAEIAEGLGASLRFDTDLFDGATIERLGGHLQNLLAGAAADPRRRLADLPLLAPAEERELLVDSNRTVVPYDRAVSVEMQVAARAERTPEAPAVAMGGEGLTYAELDERAGRLAGRLRVLGVGPETRVAVAMERSPVLVVALLAVWKA